MRLFTLFLMILSSLSGVCQEKSEFEKFGKITPELFQKKVYSLDSNASAVVLSDIGDIAVIGNSKSWFSTKFTRHRVVHVLNKSGYDEGDVQIRLYTNGDAEEKLENLKAVTYNLENGKVVETKLEKSSIFREKISKNFILTKFTLPNVKEGCILEFQYTVVSDFIQNLDPWYFQGDCPTLWSELRFSVPEFFIYNFLSRGYQRIAINEQKEQQEMFTISDSRGTGPTETARIPALVTNYRWVMKDVPELKNEAFTSSVTNHLSRIELQLASQRFPLKEHEYRSTWANLNKALMESDHFGGNLSSSNGWMGDEVKPIFASGSSNEDKARKIYQFVRDQFTSTGHSGIFMDQSLKNIFKTRKGSAAEINLMLSAMLRYAGLDADPVVLSTREHGYVWESTPMLNHFNHVIVLLRDNGNVYYLDASNPRLGFNRLPSNCYNGYARVINNKSETLSLSADSLRESKTTQIIVVNDEKGNWTGSMKQTLGYEESYAARERVQEKGKDAFFKEIERNFGSEITLKNPVLDSLKSYDNPVRIQYNFDLSHNGEEIIYVNPTFGEGYKKNPFTASVRSHPVEMPFSSDEMIVVSIEVPKGYVLDELPKQALIKYDEEGKTFFEYRITQSNEVVSFRSRIKIDRALFMPEEYEGLREFFNFVVSKQNEQIVFKKKK